MIKLKIGDNYLITTAKDYRHRVYIQYMMSCFQGSNKIAMGFSGDTKKDILDKYIQFVAEVRPSELYILSWGGYREVSRNAKSLKALDIKATLNLLIRAIKEACPTDINIKIIKIDDALTSRKMKIADKVYNALIQDNNSILSQLRHLDEYRELSTRYKNIPSELKVINESIKNFSKEKKVTNNITTLKDLEYLNLIDKASLEGRDLVLEIKPLELFPSEKFGDLYTEEEFTKNKYLYEATKYLYMGYNFGMVGTKISIDPHFTPRFIETLDHSFDDMFAKSNWSNIGYLHFGKGHLCGGEFNNVIAHASEHGMEYYFLCLKQYITTGNVRDYAGQKIWWYPIYDKEGKIIYCAGLDMLRDTLIKNNNGLRDELMNMSWEEFLTWKKAHNINFCDYRFEHESSNTRTNSPGKEDRFLKVVKEQDPELYDKLKKGAM